MHPELIKYDLKIRGYIQKRLALEIGVSPFIIHCELHKMPRSEPVCRQIARIIERNPEDVLPEYYSSARAKYSPARTKACG